MALNFNDMARIFEFFLPKKYFFGFESFTIKKKKGKEQCNI